MTEWRVGGWLDHLCCGDCEAGLLGWDEVVELVTELRGGDHLPPGGVSRVNPGLSGGGGDMVRIWCKVGGL